MSGEGQDDAGHGLLTVTELAAELGVTPRAIRFYETKGLVSPARIGTHRVYNRRDRGRMALILRGKRLGFTLRDIKTFLDLYDVDPTQRSQMLLLLQAIQRRRADLEEQQRALAETLDDLNALERQALEHMNTTKTARQKAG